MQTILNTIKYTGKEILIGIKSAFFGARMEDFTPPVINHQAILDQKRNEYMRG